VNCAISKWSPVHVRLSSKTTKSPNGCWIWGGKTNPNGYGIMQINKTQVGVHVVAFELANGKLGPGKIVCHSCDVRNCVNPDHLFSGTHADNMADMVRKNRTAPPGKKLCPSSAMEIRRSNLSAKQISKLFNITTQHALQVKKGIAWAAIV